MKKIIAIFIVVFAFFSLSAGASEIVSIEITKINEEAEISDVVLYTKHFGDSVLSGEVNDEHGFADFYAVVAIPISEGEDFGLESVPQTVMDNMMSNRAEYEVESIYTPSAAAKNIPIPENGFVLLFPSDGTDPAGERILGADRIQVGAQVSLTGIDVENGTKEDGATVEIEIYTVDFFDDIPQTSDNQGIYFFSILTASAVVGIYAAVSMKRNA